MRLSRLPTDIRRTKERSVMSKRPVEGGRVENTIVEEKYTADEIGEACMLAGVSEGQYLSIMNFLGIKDHIVTVCKECDGYGHIDSEEICYSCNGCGVIQ